MFLDRPELKALYELLITWGFYEYGVKKNYGQNECVLVKQLGVYDKSKSVLANYPTLQAVSSKYILPIFPQYHTSLFPDSILSREKPLNLMDNVAHRYALQKAYITWASCPVQKGDIILFYRTGETYPKKYSSVITTVGVVDRVVNRFCSEQDFLAYCQNRTVFATDELIRFWREHRCNLSVIKFVYVKSLTKKVNLEFLWNNNIIISPNGPRPFTKITDKQFEKILIESQTEIYAIGE